MRAVDCASGVAYATPLRRASGVHTLCTHMLCSCRSAGSLLTSRHEPAGSVDAGLLSDQRGCDVREHGARHGAEQTARLAERASFVLVGDVVSGLVEEFDERLGRGILVWPKASASEASFGEAGDDELVEPATRFGASTREVTGFVERLPRRVDVCVDVDIAGMQLAVTALFKATRCRQEDGVVAGGPAIGQGRGVHGLDATGRRRPASPNELQSARCG